MKSLVLTLAVLFGAFTSLAHAQQAEAPAEGAGAVEVAVDADVDAPAETGAVVLEEDETGAAN